MPVSPHPYPRWVLAVINAALGVVCVFACVQTARAAIIPAKAMVAQVLLRHAWQRTLSGEAHAKPWPWADTWPTARIRVERLGTEDIALESASGQAMAFGPGHLAGSAEPGQAGTAVYAAHRDTHFRMLEHVRGGDIVYVQSAHGETYRYEVTATRVVPSTASGIARADVPGAPAAPAKLALVTCYPFGAITHGPLRYVVEATLVE